MNNQENKIEKRKKPRCSFAGCNKKVGMLNQFKCRCDLMFCSIHKLPEDHNCQYNYKNDKIKLEKVVAEKLIKI